MGKITNKYLLFRTCLANQIAYYYIIFLSRKHQKKLLPKHAKLEKKWKDARENTKNDKDIKSENVEGYKKMITCNLLNIQERQMNLAKMSYKKSKGLFY